MWATLIMQYENENNYLSLLNLLDLDLDADSRTKMDPRLRTSGKNHNPNIEQVLNKKPTWFFVD